MQNNKEPMDAILPIQTPRNDDTHVFALSNLFDSLRGKMLHNAYRFEDDEKPHVPTYGLRVAADGFGRAAVLIFQEKSPLSFPVKTALKAHLKTVSIGLNAFGVALEHDWDLIKPKCGLHCKTCTSRGTAEYLIAIRDIINDWTKANRKATVSKKPYKQFITSFETASESLIKYVDKVKTSRSFKNTSEYWERLSIAINEIAETIDFIL